MAQFDVVLWGATGFTGRLVAEFYARRYPPNSGVTWAIAGRSQSKLDDLRKSLGSEHADLPTLTADSRDRASLDVLCSQAKTICTTVGPYAKYGAELVAACAESGTHYCDLAGEAQFMRRMIDQHHDAAKASGAIIVHACGFDSIPSDMGVYYLQQQCEAQSGRLCDEVKFFLKASSGGASGGTVASLLNAVDEAKKDRETARALADPYSLYPRGEPRGQDRRDDNGLNYDQDVPGWTGPFVMAAINTKVVRRGNAIAGFPYGKDFRYSEKTLLGEGAGAWLKGATLTAGLGGFMVGASFAPTRSLLQKFVLPEPGEGPDADARHSGFFNILMVGKINGKEQIRVKVTGDRDPGYGSTSKMLGESALCLAQDDIAKEGGFWTPASAMGEPLLHRLTHQAGLTFSVLES